MTASAQPGEQSIRKAAEVVAAKLRRRVILGQLDEGDVLPGEKALLSEFGVSRPTLRQAIRILESESLVSVRRGSLGGIHVSVPRVEMAARYAGVVLEYRRATITDLFEAACAIEAPCAAMLARSRTEDDLRELRAAVEAERAARDNPQRFRDRQNDFHRLLVDRAGNITLRVLSDMLRCIIGMATDRYLATTSAEVRGPAFGAGRRTHQRVVDLIEQRDADGADALWRRHIRATAAQLRQAGVPDMVVDLSS